MKTSATKTSKTTSRTATKTASQPFFAKAGQGSFFAPAGVQMKMTVNKPGDKFEQEADKMADKVMRMASPPTAAKEDKLQKAEPEQKIQKKDDELKRKGGDSTSAPSSQIQSSIRNKTTGGQPLGSEVRSYMEPRFGADFSNIRIHTDPEAASLNNQLSARAFTYQNHVFFSRDQYQPGTGEGKHLLAHELTHTIQQGHASQHDTVHRSTTVTQTTSPPPTLQRQEENTAWYHRAGNAISSTVSSVVEFGEDVGWRLLNEFAPELVPIVQQGPINWLQDKLLDAVASVFSALTAPLQPLINLVPSLTSHFATLIHWIQHAAARLSKGDCSALAEAAEKVQQVFEGLAAPIVDRIKQLASRVKNFFGGLWDRFGAPVWQFLQRIGGTAWQRIQQIGHWIWEKTAPIRRVLNRAWTWVKNKLGIGEGAEGQDGILQWIQRKAQYVWDEYIKPFYERYRQQILVITGILVMLSPAGPIIALGAAIAGLAAGIRWIRQYMRNRQAIVQQRGILQGVIIPGILGAVNNVSSFLIEKTRTLSGHLIGIVNGLNRAVGSIAGSILNFAVRILQWLIDRFQELVAWAMHGLISLVRIVTNVLNRLVLYLRPVLQVLREITQTVADIWHLPRLLAGRLWHSIPACIRNPFIDFFIPLILRQIAFFRELAASPEAWQQTRTQVMGLIQQIFHNFDLMGAIHSAFHLVVRALRIPIDLMGQLLDKAANAWDAVIAAPLRFIENALKSILQGVGLFMRNIFSHLSAGVQGWLFNAVNTSGSSSGVTISPPASWTDFRAVFGFVLDVLGISVDHVITLIDRRIPGAGRPLRAGVRFMTGALEWLQIAIEQGPRGLWQNVVERLQNLGTILLESAVNWVMTRVVAIVSVRLTALAASAGLSSVLEAIKAVYSAIQTAIEYMPRILGIMIRVFDSVTQIAAGVLRPAAETIEGGFRMAMPVVIGFLANYAGLGGIGEYVVEIIQNVRQRIDDAILWLIDRTIAAIRGLLNLIKTGAIALLQWWKKKIRIGTGNNIHTLYFQGEENSAVLYIASTPKILHEYLGNLKDDINFSSADKIKIINAAQKNADKIKSLQLDYKKAKKRGHFNVAKKKGDDISACLESVGKQLGQLFAGDTYGTEVDPIPLDWPGPESKNYPKMYFGGILPPSRRPKSQVTMKKIHNKGLNDETGIPIEEYSPHTRKKLSSGKTIGLKSEFFITVGSVVGPLSQETTEGGDLLLRIIEPCGFNSTNDTLQLDHVHEIQFGGIKKNDRLENLWPLESSKNSRKGSALAGAQVEYPRGHLTKIRTLKLVQNNDVKNKKKFFFKINSVE